MYEGKNEVKKIQKPMSVEQAEKLIAKSLYSPSKDLFEKIVNSNPALLRKQTFRKMWWNFFEELFPHPHHSLSLSLVVGGMIFTTMFLWNLFFSPIANQMLGNITIIEQSSYQSDFVTNQTVEVNWEDNLNSLEDNLNSLLVGKFWNE